MAGLSKKSEGSEYNIVYSGFRGVDFSGDGETVSRSRLSYAENVYIDYEGDGGGALESIPGFRKLCSIGSKIKRIFTQKLKDTTYVYIQAGETLYRSTLDELNAGKEPVAVVGFANDRASAVTFGADCLLLNGQKLIHVDSNAIVRSVASGYEKIYIPTTYVNGKRFEQGNLLTRTCYESYHIGSADTLAYESSGLQYRITDIENKTCAVTGIEGGTVTELYIPSKIKISDETYSVTAIDDYAFYANTAIQSVYVANGTRIIGKFAFAQCSSLKSVILPDSVGVIDNACFSRAINLSSLHLGLGLTRVGQSVTSMCTSLKSITYAGNEADYQTIENLEALGTIATVTYEHQVYGIRITLPISGPAVAVCAVKIGGETTAYHTESEGGAIKRVIIDLNDKRSTEGKEAVITLTYSSTSQLYGTHGGIIANSYFDYLYCDNAILHCTRLCCYDGRIFAAGNPNCPGVVFYSSRDKSGIINPLYFGENDYFDERDGGYVSELLPTSDSLAVFCTTASGETRIFYHEGKDTDIDLIPRIYPVTYTHRGLGESFDAIPFFDDYVFLSKNGLLGIDKSEISLSRNITTRSNNVNTYLLRENLSTARMALWMGYLVIAVDGRMYLADSRQRFRNDRGGMEYEWFFLNRIGTYTGDGTVYRYASEPLDGLQVKEGFEERAVADGTTISYDKFGQRYSYYSTENGTRYAVYSTDERHGGVFNPVCAIEANGNLLLFGTENGDLCVFNNDMRGTPPLSLYLSEDYDEQEYRRSFGARIESEYYSFASHPAGYVLSTTLDNAGVPNSEKSTVKGTLAIKCKSHSRGQIRVEAEANGGTYSEVCVFPSTAFCFDNLDFSTLSLSCEEAYTRAFSEKLKGWVEKRITVSSFEYCSPIAIHSIAYIFKTKGKIKNK